MSNVMTRNEGQISSVVKLALREDIGNGDVTTQCTVPAEVTLTGRFIAREPGVIAGLEVVKETFSQVDDRVQLTFRFTDSESVERGGIIVMVKGPGRAVISGERVALNFLQRMSGIATLTRRFVEAVQGMSAVILDTRKTVPGLRVLDKWAVRLGGGQNHRFDLSDASLIKENHIVAVGGISKAVARVQQGDKEKRPIEVEVKTMDELRETLELSIDRIMLDNMSLEDMREAVQLCNGRIPLEASGNITLENVAAIAATGVDYISIGMLTHSVQALDITFLLDRQ